jgi:nucleoside-diphosphate-sugar epimerase
VLAVEGDERELRRRRRLGLGAPLAVVAAGEQHDCQERAGAPVDSAAMKVLVTGASGFVGRALVEELRHADAAYEVQPLGRQDGDLSHEGVAEAAVAEARARGRRPRAARIGVVRCEDEPELAVRSNVLATRSSPARAAASGARLVYLSTSDVYGSAAAGRRGDAAGAGEPLPR